MGIVSPLLLHPPWPNTLTPNLCRIRGLTDERSIHARTNRRTLTLVRSCQASDVRSLRRRVAICCKMFGRWCPNYRRSSVPSIVTAVARPGRRVHGRWGSRHDWLSLAKCIGRWKGLSFVGRMMRTRVKIRRRTARVRR